MAGINFMDTFKGVHGNYGKQSWDRAIAAGYNPQQIKTALQQQGSQGGYLIGSALRTEMQKHKGAAHGMSRYQGYHGNIGLTGYMKAKQDGYSHDEILAGTQSQGMFLAQRAAQQYAMDQRNQEERDMMLDYMKQLTAMMNRPAPSVPEVGRSTNYTVGKGGASGVYEQEDEKKVKDDKTGTQQWKRLTTAPTGAGINTTAGYGGGKPGGVGSTASSALNIAQST